MKYKIIFKIKFFFILVKDLVIFLKIIIKILSKFLFKKLVNVLY